METKAEAKVAIKVVARAVIRVVVKEEARVVVKRSSANRQAVSYWRW